MVDRRILSVTRKLEKKHWVDFFNRLSKQLKSSYVKLEVLEPTPSNQLETRYLPLGGITFDPRDESLSVITDSLNHQIRHPRAIFVLESQSQIQSIEVIDHENRRQVLTLKNRTSA